MDIDDNISRSKKGEAWSETVKRMDKVKKKTAVSQSVYPTAAFTQEQLEKAEREAQERRNEGIKKEDTSLVGGEPGQNLLSSSNSSDVPSKQSIPKTGEKNNNGDLLSIMQADTPEGAKVAKAWQ